MAKIGAIPTQVNDPSTKLDPGNFLFSVEDVKEGDFEGKFLYDAIFRVVQPASHQGQLHYERWWIGSDEDQEATLPATWTANAGKMKKCAEACAVPFLGQNPDIVIQQMRGKQVCGQVIHKPGTRDGKPVSYANIKAWGQAGTMTPQVVGADNGQQPVGAPVATPAPGPAPAISAPVPQPGVGTGMPPAQQGGASPLPPGAPQYR